MFVGKFFADNSTFAVYVVYRPRADGSQACSPGVDPGEARGTRAPPLPPPPPLPSPPIFFLLATKNRNILIKQSLYIQNLQLFFVKFEAAAGNSTLK